MQKLHQRQLAGWHCFNARTLFRGQKLCLERDGFAPAALRDFLSGCATLFRAQNCVLGASALPQPPCGTFSRAVRLCSERKTVSWAQRLCDRRITLSWVRWLCCGRITLSWARWLCCGHITLSWARCFFCEKLTPNAIFQTKSVRLQSIFEPAH